MDSEKKKKNENKILTEKQEPSGNNLFSVATSSILVVVVLGLALFNTYLLSGVSYALDTLPTNVSTSSNVTVATTSTNTSAAFSLPTGVPKTYGSELGVSFDDVTANSPTKADTTIRKLALLDTSINLSASEKKRYISVASQISCEYCCGARSIITSAGQPACGCAHSYAMRGLAKYLITKHSTEYTNDEILTELAKWKSLFFPTQSKQKAAALANKGIAVTFVNIGSNKYTGIESGSTGGMVGGC
jgi:hypothetical protein